MDGGAVKETPWPEGLGQLRHDEEGETDEGRVG